MLPSCAALLLTSCGAIDVHAARDPKGTLIGMSVADLLGCMGIPDNHMVTIPGQVAIAQWSNKSNDVGFKAGAFGASLQIGGGGECKAVFTVLRDGTVADVAFPGAHEVSLFSAPYSECEPLIHECLAHPSQTGLSAGYDAISVLTTKP